MFFNYLLPFSPVEMEGEKERQWQQREEKEFNEAEDDRSIYDTADNEDDECLDDAALVWQECYSDNLNLPIMHWEALSLRIAELEKQEEEKKEKKTKVRGHSKYWRV